MTSCKKVGLIGIGAIGQHLYENLQKEGVEVAFIYARRKIDGQPYSHLIVDNFDAVVSKCKEGVDLVIEAATADAFKSIAPVVLPYSDMAALSSTAFADQPFYEQIKHDCQEYEHSVFIPHGAVMGLDGISDSAEFIEQVKITTTKSPQSLGRTDQERTVVYNGSTRGACELYPRNVNVHATTALAGLGFDKTISVIVSDPDTLVNQHVIEVNSSEFAFKIQTMSQTASKVSSAYTLVSAYNSVRRVLFKESVVVI